MRLGFRLSDSRQERESSHFIRSQTDLFHFPQTDAGYWALHITHHSTALRSAQPQPGGFLIPVKCAALVRKSSQPAVVRRLIQEDDGERSLHCSLTRQLA